MEWLLHFSALTAAVVAAVLIYKLVEPLYTKASRLQFFSWLASTIRDPHNFPHFLVALFTLLLAAFAYNAWLESKRGTAALEGQLKALLTEQRPYIGPTNTLGAPEFHVSPQKAGQIVWQYQFENYGHGLARELQFRQFIKVGDGGFKPSYGSRNPDQGSDMAPTTLAVAAAISAPDLNLTQDVIDKLSKIDRSIGILVEFQYQDINEAIFTSAICLERFATGAIALLQPRECEKQKAQ